MFCREVFETSDGAEIALDWWDPRLKPESPAEVPVVPSSLLDSLSYYYNSLPHLRMPQLQLHMRMPQIQIPYFGPLRRSASAAGIELAHLEHSALSDDDSEVDSGAYSPKGERAVSEKAYSERAPSPELGTCCEFGLAFSTPGSIVACCCRFIRGSGRGTDTSVVHVGRHSRR